MLQNDTTKTVAGATAAAVAVTEAVATSEVTVEWLVGKVGASLDVLFRNVGADTHGRNGVCPLRLGVIALPYTMFPIRSFC